MVIHVGDTIRDTRRIGWRGQHVVTRIDWVQDGTGRMPRDPSSYWCAGTKVGIWSDACEVIHCPHERLIPAPATHQVPASEQEVLW